MTFDPNAASTEDSGIFGLPFNTHESKLVLIPVPWEATTSYGGGTSLGPQAIFNASKQIDLYDLELGNFYEAGIAMQEASPSILQWNKASLEPDITKTEINFLSTNLNQLIYQETKQLLSQNKLVGLVGGDHSSPFGAIQAFLEKFPNMGILHIDAHADLRAAFNGFEYSHASIMHNVITKTPLKKLIQVGIRDTCEEEINFINSNPEKIHSFFDYYIFAQKAAGKNWHIICEEIIKDLPTEVYISFDIDGLDPRYCPHTGTPVPGGLDFNEVLFLFRTLKNSGRKVVGFDLNEVSPGPNVAASDDSASEWDANVGARLLYKLCGYTIRSTLSL